MTELPSRTNVYIYEGMEYADTGKTPKYNNEPKLDMLYWIYRLIAG